MKIIIEHLEPELYNWCLIEYKHISEIVGKNNLIFANIKKKDIKKLSKLGKVETKSVKDLNIKRVCILDPLTQKTLSPEDSELFDYFVFGGILGNEPMEGRTKKELSIPGVPRRNLGKLQMSTDTAVLVTYKIINKKISFSRLKFKDEIEIKIGKNLSTILPYRYLVEKNKVILPKGLIKHLKTEDSFN